MRTRPLVRFRHLRQLQNVWRQFWLSLVSLSLFSLLLGPNSRRLTLSCRHPKFGCRCCSILWWNARFKEKGECIVSLKLKHATMVSCVSMRWKWEGVWTVLQLQLNAIFMRKKLTLGKWMSKTGSALRNLMTKLFPSAEETISKIFFALSWSQAVRRWPSVGPGVWKYNNMPPPVAENGNEFDKCWDP